MNASHLLIFVSFFTLLLIVINARWRFSGTIKIVSFSGLAVTFLNLIAPTLPLFNLFDHFSPHMAFMGAIIAMIAVTQKMWISFGMALGVFSINLLFVGPDFFPHPKLEDDYHTDYISFLNTHRDAVAISKFSKLPQVQNAHFIGMVETPKENIELLMPIFPNMVTVYDSLVAGAMPEYGAYPYRVSFFSSRDFTAQGVAKTHTQNRPYIITTVELSGQPVNMAVVHPFPPVIPAHVGTQEALLLGVIDELKEAGLPFIMMGDFNAAPGSHIFRKIKKQPDIERARCSGALWPMSFPAFLPIFGIQIDHIVVSTDIDVSCEIGPNIGSDHRPIFARVRLKNIADGK